jgi:hypothetical protein
MINYDQEIYEGAIKGGANPSLAKLLVAQARNESGHYSSNQTKVNNNIFGFKHSTNSNYSKKGNISPEGDPYAHYDTLQDAIKDYIVRWMNKPSKEGGTRLQEFNKIKDGDTLTYARKLKGYGYFGNKSGESDESSIQRYASNMASTLLRVKVVAFYLKNEKKINYGLIGVVLLVVSFIAYRYYKKNK